MINSKTMKSLYVFYNNIGLVVIASLIFFSCEDYYDTNNNPITYGETYFPIDLTTDKPIYQPGEPVLFNLAKEIDFKNGEIKVRYSHLGTVLSEELLVGKEWTWNPPQEDYKGYLVDLYRVVDGKEDVLESIAIDVSSDWTRFPRYGFLSSYGTLSNQVIQKNIANLARYRINGVQFYDWMYDHHKPLAGSVSTPLQTWPDLIGRTNTFASVEGYINALHEKGMKAMFYNLCFGALDNALSDGVNEEWYIFKDDNHEEKDNHHLDAPFRSSIYLLNPANIGWQEYISKRHKDVYDVFNFDGYHIDQLGGRGTVYDYNGQVVELDKTYGSFVNKMKELNPDKYHVMNAVNQFGQKESIAQSEVDFLYTEVWDPNTSYEQLASIILDNQSLSNNEKNVVLAAYMNYDISNSFGYINAPGVLLTNSVIFAFGGAHIELGEHYLSNEYFPNENLQMRTSLSLEMVTYYDFLTAYENLLRDGGEFKTFNVSSTDGKMSISNWPASKGEVATIGKEVNNKEIIHFINFTDANSMDWGDKKGLQIEPKEITDANVNIQVKSTPKKIWLASPNYRKGVATELDFTSNGNSVLVTIPYLKYWDMIVVEY